MGMALWALLLVPGLSQALGLGEIEINSALNQPLNAEIELVSVRSGEMEDLQVRIAPEALYRRLGVERSALLTELRFSPQTLPDGRHVVRVTTRNPVREPFVNFLVEATWPAGRLVREYTLLLDPPVLFEQRAEPAPRAPVTEAPRDARPAPAPSRPAPRATAPRSTPDSYRVQRGDTLWNVARDLRPDNSVSVEQMMLALLRANPEAFSDNNINNLQSGRVLRVPDLSEINRLDQAQARAEVARQNALWREYRTRVAGETQPQVPAPARTDGPAPSADAPAAPAQDDARLEILAAREGEQAQMEQELALAREAAETRAREARELSSRVAELEAMLESRDRLLELNSQQLAEMQARLEGREPEAREETEAAPAVTDRDAPAVSEAEPTPAAPPELEAPTGPLAMSEAERMAMSAGETPTPAAEAAPEAPAAAPAARTPAPAAPTERTPASLVDEILASPNLMMIAGLVILLVLLLIWLMIKRLGRNKGTAAMATPASVRSEPSVSGADGMALAGAGGALAGAAIAGSDRNEEQAEVSDEIVEQGQTEPDREAAEGEPAEAMAPASADEYDEITNDDTIAEVDVYLAYGLYSQAEDLLNKSVEEHPERVDYRFKLAETHFATRNAEAFEANAQQMHETLAGRPSQLWERVQSMGQDLSPDNPLFLGAAALDLSGAADEQNPEVDLDLGVQDLDGSLEDMDLDEEPRAVEPASKLDETLTTGEVDLDLDAGGEFAPAEGPVTADDESLEFDLGDLDLDADNIESELLGASASESETILKDADGLAEGLETEGLDLDLDAASDELAVSAGETPETQAPETERPAMLDTSEDETQIMEEDFSDLDFLGEGDEGDELLMADDEDEALPSGDEVSTKLDLARAYIDMGDSEGARSTLEEVLSEGNDAQKQEAQGLLDQLS
jgi:pilus assembly protein FimV